MTKILVSLAALTIVGAAALPLQASAAEQKPGISTERIQSTDVSSRRRYYRHRYYARHYWGPRYYARPYWGPRYYARPYWGPRYYGYGYPYYGYPGYYRPGLAFGIGPFGFGIF